LNRFNRDQDRWQEPAVLWCGLTKDAAAISNVVDASLADAVLSHFASALAGANGGRRVAVATSSPKAGGSQSAASSALAESELLASLDSVGDGAFGEERADRDDAGEHDEDRALQ
jgi:hypothetical protein